LTACSWSSMRTGRLSRRNPRSGFLSFPLVRKTGEGQGDSLPVHLANLLGGYQRAGGPWKADQSGGTGSLAGTGDCASVSIDLRWLRPVKLAGVLNCLRKPFANASCHVYRSMGRPLRTPNGMTQARESILPMSWMHKEVHTWPDHYWTTNCGA
jgi:hypothetical protein